MEFVYFHNKKLTFKILFYFFLRCEPERIFYFLFFFLRRGQKDPCRTLSTKQYTECRLISLTAEFLMNACFFSIKLYILKMWGYFQRFWNVRSFLQLQYLLISGSRSKKKAHFPGKLMPFIQNENCSILHSKVYLQLLKNLSLFHWINLSDEV